MSEQEKKKRFGCGGQIFVGLLIAFIFLLALDRARIKPELSEVLGTYVYKLSTGEVEAISLSKDFTFEHFLFQDRDSFVKGGPAVMQEKGSWTENWDGKEYRVGLRMRSLYEFEIPNLEGREAVPVETNYTGEGAIARVTRAWARNATPTTALVRNEDAGYLMHRIDRPEEIDSLKWRYPLERSR